MSKIGDGVFIDHETSSSIRIVTSKIRALMIASMLLLSAISTFDFFLYRHLISANGETSHLIEQLTKQKESFTRVSQILVMLLTAFQNEESPSYLIKQGQKELGRLAKEISLRQLDIDQHFGRLNKSSFSVIASDFLLPDLDKFRATIDRLTANLNELEGVDSKLIEWRFSLWAPIIKDLTSDGPTQRQLDVYLTLLNKQSFLYIDNLNQLNLINLIGSFVLLVALFFGSVRPLLRKLKNEHTKLEVYQNRLLDLALLDPLTNIGNRRAFLSFYEEKIRESPHEWIILLIDLDEFKSTNDVYGYTAGDFLLHHVAKTISSSFSKGSYSYRLGGDEFLLLIDRNENEIDIDEYISGLLSILSSPIIFGDIEISCSASIGGFIKHTDLRGGVENVLSKADFALRSIKKNKKGHYYIYSKSDSSMKVAREVKAQQLLSAIQKSDIIPYYQPIVDLTTFRTVGFETLARWRTDNGLIAAGRFVDIIIDFQLEYALTETILKQVGSHLSRLSNLPLQNFRLHVNIPQCFLVDKRMIDKIMMLTNTRDLNWLSIEILEHVFFQRSNDTVVDNLNQCIQLGAEVALDDFGTGYASLIHLRNFPCNVIKIDKSFVQDMIDDVNARKIVNSIVNLAHTLGMSVVVEGIETSEQCKLFSGSSDLYGQGYYFSKAMEIDSLIQALAEMEKRWCAHTTLRGIQ